MSKRYSKIVEIEKLFTRGIEALKCTCAASQQKYDKGLDCRLPGNGKSGPNQNLLGTCVMVTKPSTS
ncbi:MAG TPA: hypothetical protein VMW06_12110 [Desulfobacterales bacterium]|nr:hypothetical protein [Desulfobacterales bacterium]